MGKTNKPTNLIGNMGLRSKRRRKAGTPPKMTPQKAQSISASLGIATHPVPASNGHLEDLDDNPELNQFLPLPEEPEAPAHPIPDAAYQFAQDSRSWWNAEARRNLKLQWNAIEFQMTATYLELQYQTRNWTSKASYLDVDINCQCSNSLTIDSVDLIDTLGFHSKHPILFCDWLLRRLRNAQTVLRETSSALSKLSQERSSLFPTIRYTYEFLREQWIVERNSQHKRCYIQEEQKIELGRLLCLEEMAQEIW
ncbi:uncharacterized protein MELLADRAFT_106941 [Melampsora larici-populina 98AG31]|uniref:CxC1-like cysteine cluster associated with KDZ transposases domain-containing protein n=1 Tax=Melampsora larici-populina (strain 98AG31 / pathotype 3-4-7) TaxID=747676 RepID=F4RN53_MELLP|nr:uncharacterized protein MELLADRAFT_106941 [Melampsora larici-populina 98AG31]EGG06277.1 hypothetical protein MELLADRAFT_106941 [Melampsora larici-populina 98AG31]